MDLIKQYLIQSITAASSNLRLNNQRIEVIAMIKEVIFKSKDVKHDLNQMKKITELSKFAIKLSEIYESLNQGSIDFLRISDKFREHSFILIKEITCMLDMINPYTFRETLDRMIESEKKVVELIIEPDNTRENNLVSSHELVSAETEVDAISEISETYLLDGERSFKDSKSFNGFEAIILKPIKSIDSILNDLSFESDIPDKIEDYSKLMRVNAELSAQNGFDILAHMHEILSMGLQQLKSKTLIPSKEVVESLRACLIVIVAVVRAKEVDIKNYLNRAEVFGKILQRIQSEGNK